MVVIEFNRKCSKKVQKLIEEAIYFAFVELMPRVKKPVYINIKPIRFLADRESVYGDIMDEGQREFTIRVDSSLPVEELLSTVMHEMVHLWQYLSRRMVYQWGHEVKFNKSVYCWNMPYNDRPWEMEAHAKEKQLMEKWNASRA